MSFLLSDKHIRLTLGLTLVAAVVIAGLASTGNKSLYPLVMGMVVVVALVQVAVLLIRWQRPGPFHQAQWLFVNGQYQETVAILKNLLQEPDGKADEIQVVTLLGNTYRQMGKLEDSEGVLRELVERYPQEAFPLYGLGRTLLAQGDFAGAANMMTRALENGARKVIRAELALAHYLNEDTDSARTCAEKVARMLGLESYRALMINYILYRVAQDEKGLQLVHRLHKDGAGYWQAEAELFALTAYGRLLKAELVSMKNLLSKSN